MTGKPEVLIVGAGPTGLVLALELAYEKVPFKIIDKAKGPGETSRAMLVVPRVLESYQKFGLSEDIIGKSKGSEWRTSMLEKPTLKSSLKALLYMAPERWYGKKLTPMS